MPGSARGGCSVTAAARSPSTSRCASSSTAAASTRSTASWCRPCCASAARLPFGTDTFDVVFSAFGALQFVADAETLVADVARVLRPGGVFAFSVTHPTRWMFQDDPGEEGLVASQSYWDRTPYVEVDDESGETRYVEHHRTIGDWVAALARQGFVLTDLHEPEWPADHDRTWGGWSRTRGVLTPGSAIYVARLGAHPS